MRTEQLAQESHGKLLTAISVEEPGWGSVWGRSRQNTIWVSAEAGGEQNQGMVDLISREGKQLEDKSQEQSPGADEREDQSTKGVCASTPLLCKWMHVNDPSQHYSDHSMVVRSHHLIACSQITVFLALLWFFLSHFLPSDRFNQFPYIPHVPTFYCWLGIYEAIFLFFSVHRIFPVNFSSTKLVFPLFSRTRHFFLSLRISFNIKYWQDVCYFYSQSLILPTSFIHFLFFMAFSIISWLPWVYFAT